MRKNIILSSDSYKASHFKQYPPRAQYVSSYIEPRYNGSGIDIEGVVNFGLTMFIKQYLTDPITREDIDEAEEILTAHGEPFNRPGWEWILNQYGGHLPIRIESVPEGSIIKIREPQLQVYNIDRMVPWLTSYIETALLRSIWYPSTVATLSREIKRMIVRYLAQTADGNPTDLAAFKLHDFGARGVSSSESAMIGGLAHLVNFMGTDTVEALVAAKRFYGMTEMPAFSIPAAEHSTITAWGEKREAQAYENMLNQFGGPNKLVAVVSDSYDLYNAVSNIWGGTLRDKVMTFGGTLVIRPDSGVPHEVVLKVLELLKEKFPTETNTKGYRMLPSCVRIIQSDGVNYQSIDKILYTMMEHGWSADNIAFGMGGALLQQVNRDTFGYAMKANAIAFDGDWVPVYKNPKTDPSKASKAGLIKFERETQTYSPINFYNSGSAVYSRFEDIRARARV